MFIHRKQRFCISFCRQIHTSSDNAVSRNRLRQLKIELHLRGPGLFQRGVFFVEHFLCRERKGTQIRAYRLQCRTLGEFVPQGAQRKAVFVTAFHNGADLPLPDIPGILRVLSGEAVVEAGGVDPVGNVL